jgi:phosphatidylserine decarboxylase
MLLIDYLCSKYKSEIRRAQNLLFFLIITLPSFCGKVNTFLASHIHDYQSLHDIFTQDLKSVLRPISQSANTFISPCDGFLSVVDHLTPESKFIVKEQEYTVAERSRKNGRGNWQVSGQ